MDLKHLEDLLMKHELVTIPGLKFERVRPVGSSCEDRTVKVYLPTHLPRSTVKERLTNAVKAMQQKLLELKQEGCTVLWANGFAIEGNDGKRFTRNPKADELVVTWTCYWVGAK